LGGLSLSLWLLKAATAGEIALKGSFGGICCAGATFFHGQLRLDGGFGRVWQVILCIAENQ
jgi:hypothetical protein